MRDRQISIRRVAAKLKTPKTILHEIMSSYLGMRSSGTEIPDSTWTR